MRIVVDRIEGNIIICEDAEGNILELDVNRVSTTPIAGDVLQSNEDGNYYVSTEETLKRRCEIKSRFEGLFKK